MSRCAIVLPTDPAQTCGETLMEESVELALPQRQRKSRQRHRDGDGDGVVLSEPAEAGGDKDVAGPDAAVTADVPGPAPLSRRRIDAGEYFGIPELSIHANPAKSCYAAGPSELETDISAYQFECECCAAGFLVTPRWCCDVTPRFPFQISITLLMCSCIPVSGRTVSAKFGLTASSHGTLRFQGAPRSQQLLSKSCSPCSTT